MDKKRYLLLVILTIVSALIVSVVFNWIFVAGAAKASDAGEEVIVAKRVTIVDEEGRVRK